MNRSLTATSLEEENVRVVVRIRPLQTMEKKNGDISCVKANADGKEVQVKVGPLEAQTYKCNLCFPNDTTQATFFSESGITNLLDSAIQGYRACAFAFGQTGAGKTFTMVGPSKGIHHKDKQVGMIARSLEYVYMKLNAMNVPYSVKIACTEIYHENVFDLFADERERVSLPVREHSTDGFFLEGCKMVECADYEIACGALDVAMRNRNIGSHDMNNRSSRSHCLTEIFIEIPSKPNTSSIIVNEDEYDGGDSQFVTRGRMSLVDLAGSERLKSTNSTGKVLHEAGFINRSLYVLGKVIAGLVRTNGDLNHKDVPYRDSKLTKLLISSLGGRCHTLLISCVSEAKGSQNETLRTLKFSMSCARIRNKPVKFLDPHDRLILDLREEIKRLKSENKKLRSTILTAPASGEKVHLLSDEDSVGLRHRAISAHSSLAPKKSKGVYAKGNKYDGGRSSPKKKLLSQKMKKSHSDFVAELSKRKDTRNIELALKNAVYDSAALHDKHHVSGSILNTHIEETDDDALSYVSKRSQQSLQKEQQQQQQLPQTESEDDSDYDSVMSAARKKMNQVQLEDLVRRRASGPMVFKTNEPLGPVRQTHAPPMNNYERAMEASRIEKLERRIAKMEKLEAKRKREAAAAAAANGEAHNNHPVTLDKYLSVHEGDSPTKQAVNGGGSIAAASPIKKKKEIKKVKPVNKDSPYLSHLNDNNNKQQPPGKPSVPKATRVKKTDGIAAANPSMNDNASVNSLESHHSALQDSILAELQEYGLDGPTPPPVATTDNKASKKKATVNKSKVLPNINNSIANNKEVKKVKAPTKINLPKIKVNEPPASPTKKPSAPSHIVKSPKKKSNEPAYLDSPARSPPINFNRMNSQGKISSPAVEAVKSKLDVLEKSLIDKQVEFEDNPGEVTREAEEKLAALQQEAKAMRKEVEIASGNYDYDYGEDEFEADDDNDSITAANTNNNISSEKYSTPLKPTPINTKIEASRSGSEPPTPQAVKASNSSIKSRVKTPVSKSPKRAPAADDYEDDDGYGDAEFEADDEDVPVKAVSPIKASEKIQPPSSSVKVTDSVKLTIDTSPNVSPAIKNGFPSAKSSDLYYTNNNNNVAAAPAVKFQPPPSTISIASNEPVFPYVPSPMKSEQPSTNSSKNSDPATSTGYSPSGLKSNSTATVPAVVAASASTKSVTIEGSIKTASLVKEPSSRKVLPPPKPVESDDDDHYDNDFDKSKHEDSLEDDYFAELERQKSEAKALSKKTDLSNAAAISLLNKSNSNISDKSLKASNTSEKQVTVNAPIVTPPVVGTQTPVKPAARAITPKKPETPNYGDDDFEGEELDNMEVVSPRSDEDVGSNNNQYNDYKSNKFGSSVKAQSVKAVSPVKTTTSVKGSNNYSSSKDEEEPMDTGYGDDDFDVYDVDFE